MLDFSFIFFQSNSFLHTFALYWFSTFFWSCSNISSNFSTFLHFFKVKLVFTHFCYSLILDAVLILSTRFLAIFQLFLYIFKVSLVLHTFCSSLILDAFLIFLTCFPSIFQGFLHIIKFNSYLHTFGLIWFYTLFKSC